MTFKKSLALLEQARLMKRYNLSVASYVFTDSLDKAISFSEKKYPVVLKAITREKTHKSEEGLVITQINDKTSLEKEFKKLLNRTKKFDLEGILVQKQIRGVEMIVGVKKDLSFGHVMMIGSGGILVELFKDVSFRVIPFGRNEFKDMLSETKLSELLQGYRQGVKIDEDKMWIFIERIQRLIKENKWIDELEFNPVIADETGFFVVDSRVFYTDNHVHNPADNYTDKNTDKSKFPTRSKQKSSIKKKVRSESKIQ